jgi:hypothetical protein
LARQKRSEGDVLAECELLARYLGMQHISLSNQIGTPETVMLEQFQWLAEKVMPAFQPTRR